MCQKRFRANVSAKYECCSEKCKADLRRYLGITTKSQPLLKIENIKTAIDEALEDFQNSDKGALDAKLLYARVKGVASVI
jgi:hypothetical protein